LGRKILSGAGSVLGGIFGSSGVGSSVGGAVADILGMGDYKVSNNTILRAPNDVPMFRKNSDGITFSYKELVTDVYGSTGFSLKSYRINPSVYATFPMLSQIAVGFEEYEFEGLVFCYKPLSGSAIASTNNTLGDVIMATEYDVSRPNFVSKADMLEYEYSNDSEPCNGFCHPVECNPSRDSMHLRYTSSSLRNQNASNSVLSNTFLQATGNALANNLADLGRFQVATQGMQAVVPVGEIWATYTVRLRKPRSLNIGQRAGVYHACSGPLAGGACVSGGAAFQAPHVLMDSTAPLGGVSIEVNNNDLLVANLQPSTSFVIFLTYTSGGNITPGAAPVQSNISNAARFFVNSSGSGQASLSSGSGQTSVTFSYNFFVTDPPVANTVTKITFTGPTTAGAVAYDWDMMVIAVPGIFNNPYLSMVDPDVDKLIERVNQLQLAIDSQRGRVLVAEVEEKASPPTSPSLAIDDGYTSVTPPRVLRPFVKLPPLPDRR